MLIEWGTHAVLDAPLVGGARIDEHAPVRRVMGPLSEGILVLADRNLAGHEL